MSEIVGLVVGKFSPLHKGHQYLIDTAKASCDRLLVISYSNPTFIHCEAHNRERWFATLYPEVEVAIFDDYDAIPHNDASAEEHRNFCGNVCLTRFNTTVDVVFSSEEYGEGFAQHLSIMFGKNVKHVLVDIDRTKFPVSGTKVRANVDRCRDMLDSVVWRGYKPRVLLLGGESTGKTTLASALGKALDAPVVQEYGRWLYDQRQGNLSFEDMMLIAENQLMLERFASDSEQAYKARLFICDTSPLTTYWYSIQMFGRANPSLERMSKYRYDIVLLCDDDFPFVQDGTRRDDAFRKAGNAWYKQQLSALGMEYIVVSGSVEQRVETSLKAIDAMMKDFYV